VVQSTDVGGQWPVTTHDQVLAILRDSDAGITIDALLTAMKIEPCTPRASAVEVVLLLAGDVRCADGRWYVVGQDRWKRILACIESYAASTGRKMFRATSALDRLPADDQPTSEELAAIEEQSRGRYTLLPNAMIKRNF
jgi:hypothetical protein